MSAEFKAFIQLFSDLHTGIREGLDPLVQEAYAKRLISLGVYQGAIDPGLSVDARTNKFLNGVKDRVSIDSSAFDDFADILFAQTGMEFLGDRLRKCKTLPATPEQETLGAGKDDRSVMRSGPARLALYPQSSSGLMREAIAGEFSNKTPHHFSLHLERNRLTESQQQLISPPPKPAAQQALKSTPKVIVDRSSSSSSLSDSPTTSIQSIPPKFQRSTSQERTSQLTPVKPEFPQLVKTTPTPTTNPGPVSSSKQGEKSPPSFDKNELPGPVSSFPISRNINHGSDKSNGPEPSNSSLTSISDDQQSSHDNGGLLEAPSDDSRDHNSLSSLESSLEFSTPMSTPTASDSPQSPPSFLRPNTESVNPVQESQPSSDAASAVAARLSSESSSDSTQIEPDTPSPTVCPQTPCCLRCMELSVKVETLETYLQASLQRERDALAGYTAEIQQSNELRQQNEQLVKHVDYLTAQMGERNREQTFEVYRLKRELETHEYKAKGFEFVVKTEKLQQQLDVANERIVAMEQSAAYRTVEYPHGNFTPPSI